MSKPKLSFLKSLGGKSHHGQWLVSAFVWEETPEGPLSGKVVDEVETNDISLAALAAHRMIDKHGSGRARMITIEIAAAKLADGGAA